MHAMPQSSGPRSGPRQPRKQGPSARQTAEAIYRRTLAQMEKVESKQKQVPQRQEEPSDDRHTDDVRVQIKQNTIDKKPANHGNDVMEWLGNVKWNLADGGAANDVEQAEHQEAAEQQHFRESAIGKKVPGCP